MKILPKTNVFLHGGDYNPDQWLDRPDILEKDIEFMKEASINCASLNIFGWSALEPEEGSFEPEWLKNIVDSLYENGIYTILGTPTGAIPHWMAQKYPEVLQVRENGQRNLPGMRHNFCYSSPVMREKTIRIDTLLAKEFGSHPGVILWHISNELGGNGTDASCHCELCQKEFRKWLRKKYQTLDRLNHCWWTAFWSHTYTDWDEIHSPAGHGESSVQGLNLDWKRFTSEQILQFYEMERETVLVNGGNLPATANFMEAFKPCDYFKFKDSLDVVSWDSYPEWHMHADEIDTAVYTAMNHSIMRSIKKQPFLLMESTPSLVNWKENNINKRPGMHMLSSMQAISHGSDSVLYFQFRKGRGAFEQYHGAVVDHDGRKDTRVFKEVAEVGRRLHGLPEDLYCSMNKPQAAIIFDWENWWAVEDAKGPNNHMDYVKKVQGFYKPFWEMGVDVDFVDMEQDLSGYSLVVAPMTYLLKEDFGNRVKEFVKGGGHYVSTYWSGIVEEHGLCRLDGTPGMFKEMLGIQWEEIDSLPEENDTSVRFMDKSYPARGLCERVRVTDAEIRGVYEDAFYCGRAAVTVKAYGAGSAWYIGAQMDEEFQADCIRLLLKEAGIKPEFDEALPKGVTAAVRQGERKYCFVQNYNPYAASIELSKEYRNLETGQAEKDRLELKAYECRILVL